MPPTVLYLPADPKAKPRFMSQEEYISFMKAQGKDVKVSGTKVDSAPLVTGEAPKTAPNYKTWSIEELLALALRSGYEEKQSPNAGVRRMRILNHIRANQRKK